MREDSLRGGEAAVTAGVWGAVWQAHALTTGQTIMMMMVMMMMMMLMIMMMMMKSPNDEVQLGKIKANIVNTEHVVLRTQLETYIYR